MKKIALSIMALAMAAVTFTSCEDVPAPYDYPGTGGGNGTTPPSESVGNGTEANPYIVTDITTNGANGSNVFVKAYIVGFVPDKSIEEAKFTAEGCEAESNVIVAASADETNVSNVMPVQLPVGAVRTGINLKGNPGNIKQEVILCGNVENYFGKPGLKAVVWAKIGGKEFGIKPGTDIPIVGTPKGTGTKEDPFNSVAANAEANKLAANAVSEQGYYIKGKVVSVKEAFSAQYGNASFYISDDGKADGQFLVFRSLYLGNQKWTEGQPNIAEGDEVVVYGKLTNYMGNTPETAQNTTYLVSVNGKTEGGSTEGGEDKPGTGEDKPAGNGNIAIDGTTLTLSNPSVQAGATTVEMVPGDFYTGNGVEVTTITLKDGTKIVFEANGEMNGPKYYSGTNYSNIRVYKNNTITFEGCKTIAKIEFSCDVDKNKNVNCVGNETATVAVDGKKMVYTNVFTEASGGGVQLRINKIVITYAK